MSSVVVRVHKIPQETMTLLRELTAATIGGDVTGLGVFVLRRHGLRPLITITDSVIDNPETSIGLATRLGYLIDEYTAYTEGYKK